MVLTSIKSGLKTFIVIQVRNSTHTMKYNVLNLQKFSLKMASVGGKGHFISDNKFTILVPQTDKIKLRNLHSLIKLWTSFIASRILNLVQKFKWQVHFTIFLLVQH